MLTPDSLISSLRAHGYLVIDTPSSLADLNHEVFALFEEFDAQTIGHKQQFTLKPDEHGENNGWHEIGGLSKYNRCREGYIFQASTPIPPMLSAPNSESDRFARVHEAWRKEVHAFAAVVLENLGHALSISNPAAFFTPQGQMDVVSGSQFHVKKIVLGEQKVASLRQADAETYVSMPPHTDPSFITFIFHNQMSSGLQVRDAEAKAFVNISPSGPHKCIIIAGTILELLTNSDIKACVHRVASTEADLTSSHRLAASFFFQPTANTLLLPFSGTSETDSSSLSYSAWKSRVYGNYYKGRKAES